MTLLPIQFWTKFKKEEFGELNPSESLDLIQNYLNEQGFNYVKRKKNKIIFHKVNGWTLFDTKSFLVSGIVKTRIKNGNLTVTNGNWMVFLIAIPFLLLILVADSKFSTLEESDIEMIWRVLAVLFGGNLIIRIIAHSIFNATIEKLIKENYTQTR